MGGSVLISSEIHLKILYHWPSLHTYIWCHLNRETKGTDSIILNHYQDRNCKKAASIHHVCSCLMPIIIFIFFSLRFLSSPYLFSSSFLFYFPSFLYFFSPFYYCPPSSLFSSFCFLNFFFALTCPLPFAAPSCTLSPISIYCVVSSIRAQFELQSSRTPMQWLNYV